MNKSVRFKVAIIGNGDINISKKTLKKDYDYIIAADGGANYCAEKNIVPDIIIGDGDSILHETKKYFKNVQHKYTGDQNTTDLEKALQHAHTLDDDIEITLFGCTSSSRLDHTQAAIQWLIKDRSIRGIITPMQSIYFVDSVHEFRNPKKWEWRVSLLPQTPTATVTITGMLWSGTDIILNDQHSGISNRVMETKANITVTAGAVLVFYGL